MRTPYTPPIVRKRRGERRELEASGPTRHALVAAGAALCVISGTAARLAGRGWAEPFIVVGLGAAALVLVSGLRATSLGAATRRPHGVLGLVVGAAVLAAVVRLVTAAIAVEPPSWRRIGADVVTFGIVHRGSTGVLGLRTIGAAAALALVVGRLGPTSRSTTSSPGTSIGSAGTDPPDEPRSSDVHPVGARDRSTGWWWIAAVSLTAVVWAGPVVAMIGRQYVERLTIRDGAQSYLGPVLPLIMWSTVICAGAAMLTVLVVVEPVSRIAAGSRVRLPRFGAAAGGVVAVAWLWRVIALLNIAPVRTDGGDPLYYHTQANTLAHGLGFIEPLNWIANGTRIPTALHGPGYPLYLSLFARLDASTWIDNRLASSLIGTGTVIIAIVLGRRLGGPLAGLLAGVFAAFYANLWTIDGVLFPEGLFIFCCGVAMVAAYRWHDHRRTIDAVVLGLAIGCAALTRGEGIFLLVLLAAPLCWLARHADRTAALRSFALVVVAAFVVMGPWMIRNARTFENFVPLSTNGNELHVYSNCDDTYSGPLLGFWSYQCQVRLRDTDGDGVADFDPPGDESQQKQYWQDVGVRYAEDHLGQVPKVVAARVLREWDLFRPLQNARLAFIEGRSPTWARVALVEYYALVAGAAVGVWSLRRRRITLVPIAAQFAAVTITAAYAYGTTRFRAPAELALCVLAAVGVAALAGQTPARRSASVR